MVKIRITDLLTKFCKEFNLFALRDTEEGAQITGDHVVAIGRSVDEIPVVGARAFKIPSKGSYAHLVSREHGILSVEGSSINYIDTSMNGTVVGFQAPNGSFAYANSERKVVSPLHVGKNNLYLATKNTRNPKVNSYLLEVEVLDDSESRRG
jgi:hypothetical protein